MISPNILLLRKLLTCYSVKSNLKNNNANMNTGGNHEMEKMKTIEKAAEITGIYE